MSEQSPLVSVVTICRDAVVEIDTTLDSVLEQSYGNLEYVVVDGASTDGTIEKIVARRDRIAQWITERDAGIYDAMNKGVRLASGEWILFMNAGDRFHAADSLARLMRPPTEGVDVIYGDHEVRYAGGGVRSTRARPVEDMWKGMVCSHQAMICRRTLLEQTPFDPRQALTADFAFLWRQFLANKVIQKRDVVVASVAAGGVSDRRRVRALRSYFAAVRDARPGGKVKAYYTAVIGWNMVKESLRSVLPLRLHEQLARLKHRLLG
jgi:glycosyltransferase involved in cell wall biosynthesis